jgi:hypothetical protein
MNSLTLKESGFAEFVPLKGLCFSNVPYNKSGVIVIADLAPTEKSASDILYIGRSKRLTRRIFGGYLSGYGGKATRKISCKLFEDGCLEKVAISWLLTDDPKTAQKDLLATFKKEHGESPAWNLTNRPPVEPVQPAKAPKASKARPAPRKPAAKRTP